MKTKQYGMSNFRFWALVWGLGLAGQLCWNIENQWFNTFIYAKIAKDSSIVTWMVATSAIVTTLSTFFFGTLADRLGSRRRFVSIGYIVWGVFTIGFGLTEFIASGTVGNGAKVSILAAVLVVLADDFMSFFGSMGNDSGFNSWINDMMNDKNRGQVGAALAAQPVIGTIVGTVLGGMLVGSNDNYQRLFWVMGIFVILMGVVSLLFMKDSPTLTPHREGSFWQQFASVFNLKKFIQQRELTLACLTSIVFFIPFNIYFVHMGNWMIHYLGFTADLMGYIMGISLLLAILLSIPAISFINKGRTPYIAAAAVVCNIIGLWTLYFAARPTTVNAAALFSVQNLPLLIGAFFAGAGYILITQSMTVWVKQLYPENSRGQFEGIRVVSFTMIPMVIGTVIGNLIVKNSAGTVVNEYGLVDNIPTESIFLWAALLVLLTFIPLFFAARHYFAREKTKATPPA